MKKILIFTAFLITSGTIIHAQDIRFGVKGGFSFNTYALENLNNGGTRLGFQAGILTEIGLENAGLSERFVLQPEVLFATKGAKYYANMIKIKERLTYIDIPILFKYKPLEYLNLYAGPQFSFLTHGKYKYDTSNSNNNTVDSKDAFKTLDTGFTIGTTVELANLFIDVRYGLGLRNVMTDRVVNGVSLDNEEARNRCFQLSVGHFFGE